ncbi:MAG: SHOCT domain-containing protein, partial [Lysinibacillus sp.]
GMLTTGYIQFAYSGSTETKGGTFSAVTDENSITFIKKELDKARELVDLIESKRHATAPSSPPQTEDVADQLMKLHSLVESGILTQEEFDAKKKQLLGV